MLFPTRYGEERVLGEHNPKKDTLLDAFNSFDHTGCVEGPVIDYATGTQVEGLIHEGYRYGNLAWTTEDVYNFDRHDLALDPEFCDAILALAEANSRIKSS